MGEKGEEVRELRVLARIFIFLFKLVDLEIICNGSKCGAVTNE